MRRLVAACCLLLLVPASASAADVSAGSARATTTQGGASLSNGRIARSWNTSGGVVTGDPYSAAVLAIDPT